MDAMAASVGAVELSSEMIGVLGAAAASVAVGATLLAARIDTKSESRQQLEALWSSTLALAAEQTSA